MFCPNCGANLPEGTTFCGNCGAPQNAQQPQQAPQQPAYQPQPSYQPQPMYQMPPQPVYRAPLPVSKKEYLAKHADEGTKGKAKLVNITLILSILLILASIFVPLATPFFDIPVMSTMLTIAEADADELTEELEGSLKELKAEYKYQKEFMEKDERKAAEAVMDSAEKLLDNFSVLNFTSFVSVAKTEGEGYMDDADIEEMEQIAQIMYIVIGVLAAAFLLPLLFAILGGVNKSTGLTVTALVFTVLSQLTLCGILFVVLSLVIFIAQAVLCSGIKKNYEAFRMGRPV